VIGGSHILELRQGEIAECDEIFRFNAEPIAHQCAFGEIFRQLLNLAVVATIDGRNSPEWIVMHRRRMEG
jgi:hypothetical protein